MSEYIEGRRHGAGERPQWLRLGVAAAAALAAALTVTACGSTGSTGSTTTSSTTTPGAAGAAVVAVVTRASLGAVLVDGATVGTLYRYKPDGTGASTCSGACATAWPPLVVPVGTTSVTGGPGVPKGRLGIITRPDHSLQVTFAGMPLYRFAGDSQPTQANGQGIGGVWFVVHPTDTALAADSSSTSTTKVAGY
jgi:predicted lipoprotein with Yx(FWY)xxD motif